MDKYRRHIEARKDVLTSIGAYLNLNKLTKARTYITLKEYFKDEENVCQEFYEQSYKYESPKR
jgi:hypothetical protein